MRAALTIGILVATGSLGAVTRADAAVWCRSDGARSYCGFPSLQQCVSASSVMGGRCMRQPMSSQEQERPRTVSHRQPACP